MGFFNKTNRRFFCIKNFKRWVWWKKCNEKFFRYQYNTPLLERSISAASKLKIELPTDLEMESIPLKELSSLVEDIHVKTTEVSQNTDLDMQEFLGIDKALQSIQGELLNNTSKLTEVDKRIK